MKTSLLLISGVSLLFLTGCATDPKRLSNNAERSINAYTGRTVQWMQTPDEEDTIQNHLKHLLQKDLTLTSAVQIALLNNRALQAEFEEIGIAQADRIQAGLPKNIELSGSWRVPESAGVVNAEYSVAADFLDLILLPLRKKVAARNLEAATLRVSDEVLSLAAQVQSAFYTLQGRQQLLKRLQQIVAVNEATMDLAKRQHDAGNITDLEFLNQQTAYSQARLAVSQTQKDIRQDRERLNRLLGLWGENTNWKTAGYLPDIPATEADLLNLESLAIKQRLDLSALRQRLDNAGYALALRQKTRYTPVSINLGVNAERETDRSWLIGPTLDLEIPIFDRGQGAVPRLQSQYRQALRQLEATAVNIRSEVRENRDRLIANRDLADYYGKVLLPQRKRLVSETLLQYNAMQIGPDALLAAKEREIQTEREYIEALREYWIARVDLERSTGGRLAGTGRASAAKPNAKRPESSTSAESSSEHNHKH